MNALSNTLFDAELWARKNLLGASSLKKETLRAIAGFTLLWSLFEERVCENKAKVKTFECIAHNLPSSPKLEKLVNESISFYRSRYVMDQEMTPIFSRLEFRRNDRREHVEVVLKGEITEFGSKMLALLIIAYRIRCNLFHGLKSVDNWDNQAKNISEASRILSLMFEANGGGIVELSQAT